MSKVFHYYRISTHKPEHDRQERLVNDYAQQHGLTIDDVVYEKKTGRIPYKESELYKLVQQMEKGDYLMVAELLGLGRSMTNVTSLINGDLKDKEINLIIADNGLAFNCAGIGFTDSLVCIVFTMMGEFDIQSIRERSMQGKAVIRAKLARGETHVSHAGNVITGFGRTDEKWIETQKKASLLSAKASRDKVMNDKTRQAIYKAMLLYKSKGCLYKEIIENIYTLYSEEKLRKEKIPLLTLATISKAFKKGYY